MLKAVVYEYFWVPLVETSNLQAVLELFDEGMAEIWHNRSERDYAIEEFGEQTTLTRIHALK